MSRMIVVDHAKCTNCRMCELACSLVKIGAFAPSRSRIRVHVFAEEFKHIPLACFQCASAPCVKVCPAGALVQGDGQVRFVPEACIGCHMCMLGCPFGVTAFDSAAGVNGKCDTCDGDPECVRFCTPHALEFRESELADAPKGRDLGNYTVSYVAPLGDNHFQTYFKSPYQVNITIPQEFSVQNPLLAGFSPGASVTRNPDNTTIIQWNNTQSVDLRFYDQGREELLYFFLQFLGIIAIVLLLPFLITFRKGP